MALISPGPQREKLQWGEGAWGGLSPCITESNTQKLPPILGKLGHSLDGGGEGSLDLKCRVTATSRDVVLRHYMTFRLCAIY